MKIIGHRGAAGLALENTLESIKAGLKAGADVIEFDIRQTRDSKIVLSHDADLKRNFGVNLKIKDYSLRQLRTPCPNLPTLDEALKFLENKHIIIELKEYIKPELIFKITSRHPNINIKFASFDRRAIRAVKKYKPESYCYVLEHHSPFEIINHAIKMKANGIGLNYGLLNLLTYFLAKRKKLDIYIYTLNKPWIAKIIKLIYRGVDVCTDYPNKLKEAIK